MRLPFYPQERTSSLHRKQLTLCLAIVDAMSVIMIPYIRAASSSVMRGQDAML
jgi:hypothetical protein